MITDVFFGDELRLIKMIFEYAELRSQYQSLELGRFMSKSVNDIVSKILPVQYFKSSAIDLNYIYEKCETLGLDPVLFANFREQLATVEVRPSEFWNTIDEIKTRSLKSQAIPLIMSEYEKLIRATNEIEVTASLSNIMEKIKGALGRQSITIRDEDDIRQISERIKFYNGELDSPQKRFMTGYPTFDNTVGGFATSELSVFMGAPGTGKTILLINLAYALWDFGKAHVHMYSLEMPLIQVMRRFDARIFQVDSNTLRAGEFKQQPSELIQRIKDRTNSLKIFDFPPQSTVQDIEENFLKADVKPDVLVIDYAGLLRTKARGEVNVGVIADEVSMGLKYLAKKYKISVVTAIQVTGEATRKADDSQDPYDLWDAAGGTAFGRNSDIVCGMKFNPNLNIMDFGSPKNRDGMRFNFQMFVDQPKCYLYEIMETART